MADQPKPREKKSIVPVRIRRFDMALFDCRDDEFRDAVMTPWGRYADRARRSYLSCRRHVYFLD
jgi:hypothetical protein